ncbi:MAG: hypothetical protein AAFQ64_02935 [Pseudomonadota bacterium]
MTQQTYFARNHVRTVCSVFLAGVLTACGGGGGGSPTEGPVQPGPSETDEAVPRTVAGLRDGAEDLLNIWAPGGVTNYTALANVPSSGSATYDGFIYGELSDESVVDSLVGRLSIDVTFAADDFAFGGLASDFVDQDDTALNGTLTVSGGSFNRDGNPASDATLRGIGLNGTLEDSDNTTWTVGIQLEGDFLGPSADAVGGEAIGRVTAGSTALDFDGGFVAAQE